MRSLIATSLLGLVADMSEIFGFRDLNLCRVGGAMVNYHWSFLIYFITHFISITLMRSARVSRFGGVVESSLSIPGAGERFPVSAIFLHTI